MKFKKLLWLLPVVLLIVALAAGAVGSAAWFSDTETSNNNRFTAGTLDLNLDGGNTNVVKFNVSNMVPGNQPIGTWTLLNVGSVNGFVDLENITVTSLENGCVDPENNASDPTCGNPGAGEGELQNVLGLTLFWDVDGNGWFGAGDTMIYNAMMAGVASHYESDKPLNAGASTKITAQINWWSTGSDNLAQGDTAILNITFELGQKTDQ